MSLEKQRVTRMGFWAVLAFVMSSQLGSGVFLFPHTLAPYGNVTFLAWGIAGLGAMALAFLFSGLCRLYPRTGGPHVYVLEGLGRHAGFYTAWVYWVLAWLSSAPVLGTIASALCALLGVAETPLLAFVLQTGVLLALTCLNLRGAEVSGSWELVMTGIKIVPLVLFPLLALFYLKPAHFAAWNPSGQSLMGALSSASVAALWGFLGIEAITAPAGSIENPAKTIPRGIFWGTLIVLIIYVLNTVAVTGIVPRQELMTTVMPYGAALTLLMGDWGKPLVALVVLVVCLGAMNAWILAMGQVAKGAADDRLFPAYFQKTNRHGAPYVGIILSSTMLFLSLVFMASESLASQIRFVIDVSVVASIFIYALCAWVFLRLLWQQGGGWKDWFAALGSLGFSCLVISGLQMQTIFWALLLPLSGIPFVWLWGVHKTKSADLQKDAA